MSEAPMWLQTPFFDRLGWTLAQFLWQGAVVAGLAAIARILLKRSRSELRYAVFCGALLLMLGGAVATFVRGRPVAAAPDVRANAEISAVALSPGVTPAPISVIPRTLRRLQAGLPALAPWLVAAWFAGVILLSIRLLYGWRAAKRLLDGATAPSSPAFERALARLARRLRVSRPVRLIQSAAAAVPMAIGSWRPVILLPVSAAVGLTPEELEAILAHELAHIRRHDYLVNLLQTLTETLLFYHPAVWWISRQIRLERENCCDDLAVEATGDPRVYARALLDLEQLRGGFPEPALAASGGLLWRRVARLLARGTAPTDRLSGWLAGLLALAAVGAFGALTGLSAVDPAADAVVTSPAEESPLPKSVRASSRSEAPAAAPAATGRSHARPVVASTPCSQDSEESSEETPDAEPADDGSSEDTAAPPEAAPSVGPEEAAPRATGHLTPDQLVAFRIHGVTPEFVRAIAAEGFSQVSPDDLVSLRIHGVTPEFLHSMTGLLGKKSLETYVSLRIHGVTPEYVQRLSRLGLSASDEDQILALRIHGVTPEYVKAFRDAGYPDVTADDAVSLRIHGVSPSDAAAWTALGFERPSLEELVSLRIHGVAPEFVQAMRAAGFRDADLDQMTAFRIHGVTPGFAESFRALGYTTLSADEVTSFKIHGVEPELARELQALGYRSASADDLLSLRIHGVTAAYARERNGEAGRRLPLERLIEMRIHGEKGD